MVMVKSSTANVIDLESFRERRKQRDERPAVAPAMMMPVWLCWVPMWTPFVG